jgi:hypothetical protein
MNPDFDMSNGAIQEDWLRTRGIDMVDAAEEDPARESTTRPHVTGNSRLALLCALSQQNSSWILDRSVRAVNPKRDPFARGLLGFAYL